jgi:hypothetical protein
MSNEVEDIINILEDKAQCDDCAEWFDDSQLDCYWVNTVNNEDVEIDVYELLCKPCANKPLKD